jgi:ribosomal protein S27E
MNEEQDIFQEILQSQVMNIRCKGCGSEQVMNMKYAVYVKDGLTNCKECRSKK